MDALSSFSQLKSFYRNRSTYDSHKNVRQISRGVQTHLKQVYLSLCCTLIASAAGAYLHILWNIGGLLTALVCMGSMVWLLLIPPHQEQKRVALLMAAALFEGASIVPLIDLAIRIDPSILVSAFIGCGVAYGCFSVVAMLTRRREYLYLGGLLSSGLSILFWLHFASSIFGGSTALFTFELYFGLLVFVGYIVVDTNDIIEKAHFGDLDYVKHALTLFTDFAAKRALILFADFAAVFVRILIIMLKNSEEEEEEEKKRRS
ncbi:Bax inhibitor like [Actinidia chinensis var. chinensis]|uniref:Bax inhibitor like n=1 Tax=Actinidia chinensis var. chinensis TaxID=1590841 RepID=A0A2R6QJW0_ACTCC|nr:Bax inhibitor like [Actinidia chinensis var. chinensis]